MTSPVRFGTDKTEYRRAPHRNENFDEVMGLLGYSADNVLGLVDGGAFGAVAQAPSGQAPSGQAPS
ncbi:hypothetical protein QAD21_00300 [Gordonia sp. SMJS1]|nr:hypothetical protein [Gordonia sp. SMJS1]WGJ85699.1 hypothetical protein QAD21_00300 [Gordonia sp. SMJS1]